MTIDSNEYRRVLGHFPTGVTVVTGHDEDGPAVLPDPAFPVHLFATARLPDGRITGRVRHQFRDEGKGLRARLGIEFPWVFPGPVMRGHQWHLACEFSNWIEAAARDAGRKSSAFRQKSGYLPEKIRACINIFLRFSEERDFTFF